MMKVYSVGFRCKHPKTGDNTTVGANVLASCASDAVLFVENSRDYKDVDVFELNIVRGGYGKNINTDDSTVRFV